LSLLLARYMMRTNLVDIWLLDDLAFGLHNIIG